MRHSGFIDSKCPDFNRSNDKLQAVFLLAKDIDHFDDRHRRPAIVKLNKQFLKRPNAFILDSFLEQFTKKEFS